MTLATGTRLGAFEIVSLLGAGGMGEVYHARDSSLGRDVAIKVLPASLAADSDRLARFEREARLLASLNHPNIAQIFGLEGREGQDGRDGAERSPVIVMELVEGETLDARVRRTRAIPLSEALAIARQIADALDAAHERGIVHRDLKPANIVVTPSGSVKVLDFGLAKLETSDAAGPGRSDLTASPTMLGPTVDGVLLGTAPYMSPEQARGRVVDKRTDIWAFGCVLYEMLTGRRAFEGETVSDTIAAILERAPDWSRLPTTTPPHVVGALMRCLEKDPKRRLRDIVDASAELEPRISVTPVSPTAPTFPTKATAAVAALAITMAAAAGLWLWRPTVVRRRPVQFEFGLPAGMHLPFAAPSPSPDGQRVAFTAVDDAGASAIWVRTLSGSTAQLLSGTEGADGNVFWSPDGIWLAFFADGKLKKIQAAGGPALNVCAMGSNLGGTWNRDNLIVFAPANRTVLNSVPAAGGTPEPITTLNASRKENSHRWPQFLPDGRHFLFTARSDVKDNNTIFVGSLDSRDVTPVAAAQSQGMYVEPGYVLFARDGTLMAQRFDARTFRVSGDAFAVASRINHTTQSSNASFGVSADGSTLTYLSQVDRSRTLTWFDRRGQAGETIGSSQDFLDFRLSPEGRRVAVVLADADSGNRDVWLLDIGSGNLTRFTTNPANDWQMVWSPDGREIAFASDRGGRSSVFRKSADGGSEEELLLRVPERGVFPKDWSADGTMLGLNIDNKAGVPEIWAMRLSGDRAPFALGHPGMRENEVRFRSDGKWFAFEATESGAPEIYLSMIGRPARLRVSSSGGALPRWRADGRELYYTARSGDLMAVTVGGIDAAEVSPPSVLFRPCGGQLARAAPSAGSGWYDVTRDGQRFLFACPSPASNPGALTISLDWLGANK
jgi:Tol biopolymer transport system component